MKGTVNTIKEFSEDFDSLYNTWKYVVEQDDVGINIKYMEKREDKWKEISGINISFLCANKLFKSVLSSLESGDFNTDY